MFSPANLETADRVDTVSSGVNLNVTPRVYCCTSHPEVDLYVAVEWVVVDVQRQRELSLFLDVRSLKQSQTVRVQLPRDCNKRSDHSTNICVLEAFKMSVKMKTCNKVFIIIKKQQ